MYSLDVVKTKNNLHALKLKYMLVLCVSMSIVIL